MDNSNTTLMTEAVTAITTVKDRLLNSTVQVYKANQAASMVMGLKALEKKARETLEVVERWDS